FQCCRVDAITLAGRRWAVRKNMTEVAATVRAHDLRAHHAVAHVALCLDRLLAGRRVERGPTAAGVVLGVCDEQLRSATCAAVGARLEDVVVLAAERRLGSLLAQNPVLLGRELSPPLLFCFLDLGHAE